MTILVQSHLNLRMDNVQRTKITYLNSFTHEKMFILKHDTRFKAPNTPPVKLICLNFQLNLIIQTIYRHPNIGAIKKKASSIIYNQVDNNFGWLQNINQSPVKIYKKLINGIIWPHKYWQTENNKTYVVHM